MSEITDSEVRDELVGTVRRFIAREVIPVATEMEHNDTYPEASVNDAFLEAQLRAIRTILTGRFGDLEFH